MPLTTDPAFIGHQFYIKLDEVQVYVAALACHSSFRNFPKDTPAEEEEEKVYFDTIMDEQFNPKIGDQWKHYTEKDGRTMGRPENVFHFWRDNGKHLPAVQQMAYDLLAILAMNSEVERVFSGAKNTLDDKRTKLGPAVFEATELEKHWMKAGLGDDLGRRQTERKCGLRHYGAK
jgi:hypothetical protein